MKSSNFSTTQLALKISITVLGIIGTGISCYLTYIHYRDLSSICLFNTNCDAVLSSRYSTMWGIPLSLFGFLMYASLTLLSIWSLRAKEEWQNGLDMGIYAFALAGTLFTVYLFYLEIFQIHAFCTWCIGSAIVIASILVLSLFHLFGGREKPQEKSRSRRFKLSRYIQW
jgi:uncharacterized membrane protein